MFQEHVGRNCIFECSLLALSPKSLNTLQKKVSLRDRELSDVAR